MALQLLRQIRSLAFLTILMLVTSCQQKFNSFWAAGSSLYCADARIDSMNSDRKKITENDQHIVMKKIKKTHRTWRGVSEPH